MNYLSHFIVPFNDEYVNKPIISVHEALDLVAIYEHKIEVLKQIDSFHHRISVEAQNINSFIGTFPKLRAKAVKRINRYSIAINLLYKHLNS